MRHRYDVVIYHKNCADGFTAAWLAHKHLGDDAEYLPMGYDDKPPMGAIDSKHVLMVDFSFKRDVLMNMGKHAKSITILDHHKTAKDDLSEFLVGTEGVVALDDPQYFADSVELVGDEDTLPIRAWFDMERSGAGLMLSYLEHLGGADPSIDPELYDTLCGLMEFVQARDLWQLDEFPHIREHHAGLMSYPFEFSAWDHAADHPSNIIEEGSAILRAHDKTIAELLPITRRFMTIGGCHVSVANMPYTMASDAANILAEEDEEPFAATYYDNNEGKRVFSLRSSKEHGIDVSAIAKRYGGGGHKHAAGFTAPIGWGGDDWDHPNDWAPDVEDREL